MDSPYSNKVKEFTIEPECPWYDAQQSYGAPNVNWCEPTVCSVINEPANTWSNLPYMILGLALLLKIKTSPLRNFAYVVFIMGLLSFIYHATNNYLTQFFDFVGMFLMMAFLLSFNIKRLWKTDLSFFSIYWFLVFMNTAGFMVFDIVDWPAQPMMLINAAPIIILDLTAGFREGKLKQYSYFALCVFCLAVAQAFAILDIKRIWCNPNNLVLHGHVVWHVVGSFGMYFAGLHMNRISLKD